MDKEQTETKQGQHSTAQYNTVQHNTTKMSPCVYSGVPPKQGPYGNN